MKYLLLIYEDEKRWINASAEEGVTEMEQYRAFAKKHEKSILGGHALHPTPAAATVRVRDSQPLITDGPFAETKEQLGGYYLVEAGSRDEALAIAAGIPAARVGSIEVRPIMIFDAPPPEK